MKEQMLDEVIARRFLLGQLSPDEQGYIEELAFDDPQSFEVLQTAEDDLIDEFVYDDLSSEERERFQEYYLAQPGRREDVRIASALREYFDREQPVPSLWERLRKWFHIGATPLIPVMVKAAIIITAAVVGLVSLIPRILRPGFTPVTQVQPQQPPALPSPTNTPSETLSPSTPQLAHKDDHNKPSRPPHRQPSMVAAILLSPGGGARSSGEVTKVSLTSRTKHLDLALIGGTSYRSYQATLEQDGKTIQLWFNLKPTKIISGRKGIRIPIPFDRLKASQRYHIVLDGVARNGNLEHVDDYYFDATN